MATINFAQAKMLLSMFGGDNTEITVEKMDGYAGPGVYAYFTEYPDEGVVYLDPEPTPPAGDPEIRLQAAVARLSVSLQALGLKCLSGGHSCGQCHVCVARSAVSEIAAIRGISA